MALTNPPVNMLPLPVISPPEPDVLRLPPIIFPVALIIPVTYAPVFEMVSTFYVPALLMVTLAFEKTVTLLVPPDIELAL